MSSKPVMPSRRNAATLARELTQALAVDSLRLLDSVPGKSCMALEHPAASASPSHCPWRCAARPGATAPRG